MNRETAESSIAKAEEGITDPGDVRPIADSDGEVVTAAGFAFNGGEYSNDSWIVCDLEDLRTVKL